MQLLELPRPIVGSLIKPVFGPMQELALHEQEHKDLVTNPNNFEVAFFCSLYYSRSLFQWPMCVCAVCVSVCVGAMCSGEISTSPTRPPPEPHSDGGQHTEQEKLKLGSWDFSTN